MKKRLIPFLIFILLCGTAVNAATEERPKKVKPNKAPKFPHQAVWLNTKPLNNNILKKHVTLFYVWDYTAINCLRDMDLVKRLERRYEPYGFQTIWVHAPEFDFSYKEENVSAAVERLKIKGPVIMDNEFKIWEGLKNASWPGKHLVDQKGIIKHSQTGEEGYMLFEEKLRDALAELKPSVRSVPPVVTSETDRFEGPDCGPLMSEVYLGRKRMDWWGGSLANRQWISEGKAAHFKDRGERVERGFFADGEWAQNQDDFEHARTTSQPIDYVGILYVGAEVYSVVDPHSAPKPAEIYVTRDDVPVPLEQRGKDLRADAEGRTYFLAADPRLYYLIQAEDDNPHELKLWIQAKGVAVSSFSFSNHCLAEFEHL